MPRTIAYMGLTVDHLYQSCPAYKRMHRDPRWPWIGRECVATVDPQGTDLCGWCQRVYASRHPTTPTTDDV